MFFNLPLAVGGAAQLLEESQNAAQVIAYEWQENWTSIITPDSGLYGSLAWLGTVFAVGSLVIWSMKTFKDYVENGSIQFMHEMIWPIIVVYLLAGNGKHLSEMTLLMRDLLHDTNQKVLAITSTRFALDEAYQLAKYNVEARTAIGEEIKQCQSLIGEEQLSCFERAELEAEKIISDRNLKGNYWTGILNRMKTAIDEAKNTAANVVLGDVYTTVTAGIGSLIGAANQAVLKGVLLATHTGFQQAFEMALLMTALLGPLAVGGTMMPLPSRPLIAWITAMFSIGIAKLSLNIMTGVTASLIANAESGDHFWFLIFIAFFAPTLSLSLAAGGGMATWGAIAEAQRNAADLAADVGSAVLTRGMSKAKA